MVNDMAKRTIFAEFTLGYGDMCSAVRYDKDDGMWYLRKTDIFNRPIRYNPQKGILEVAVCHSEWDIYQAHIYKVRGFDNEGNTVIIE